MPTSASFFLSFASRGMAALGGVLLSIVVARITGPSGLGQFAVFLSLIGALNILARRGLDFLLMRGVSWVLEQSGSGKAVALLRTGISSVLAPAFGLGLAGSLLLSTGWLGSPFPLSTLLMPLMLPFLAGLALVGGYARGRSRPWVFPIFEIGGVSLVATAIVVTIGVLPFTSGPSTVIVGFLCALVLLAFAAMLMVWLDLRGLSVLPRLSDSELSELHVGQAHFTIMAFSGFLVQAGSFLLAAPFLTETDLGLVRAAERLALLVSFSVLAINPVIAPHIARLSRGGDPTGLRRLTGRAVLASTGIAACVLVPLMVWSERALTLMGAEFAAAVPYLRVMACAQLLAAAIGPLAMMLNMSGRERVSMWINLATLALAAALVPGLSLAYGATGFAIAYSAVIVVRLGLTAWFGTR